MLQAKLISSCDKCFIDSKLSDFSDFNESYAYINQRLSLQIALTDDDDTIKYRRFIRIVPELDGNADAAACCVTLRTVECVPVYMPVYRHSYDDGFLRTEPGLYPDLLSPIQMGGACPCFPFQTRTVWVDIDVAASGLCAGAHTLAFRLYDGDAVTTLSFRLTILPVKLPDIDFKVTQWFHCDCLADYYNVEVFSERHWEIIDNFVRTAVANGINTLLTPVFTPPLDTHVGGERPTVQLVGVKVDADGVYSFDFSLLDRWIDMCDRCGVRFFEISPLFTQWGAEHAPKILASTPDGYRRIFGWETDSTGDEYASFLRAFLGEFLSYMRARGDDKRCIFHVSDEPSVRHLEQYKKAKSIISDYVDGYTVIDALSNVDYYLSGLVSTPVCSNVCIEPFIEAFAEKGERGLWTYYCCGQSIGTSNRFIAMPGARTRFIGFQFYKYNIAGFLQWGYNFYYNQGSYDFVNPFTDTTGNYFGPAGDAFSVYPSRDGHALESMRIVQFREGLDDMRALYLCESLIGREATLAAVEKITGEIVFSRCVCDSEKMTGLRRTVDSLIASAIRAGATNA